jgi:hypothetical protein
VVGRARQVAVATTVAVCVVLGVSSASRGAAAQTLHHGCPTDLVRQGPGTFNAAIAQAKRVRYGERVQIQGTWYVTGPRNIQLISATLVQSHLNLVPGNRQLVAMMKKRCGGRTPLSAWAFVFHFTQNIVPDYVPMFVTRTSKGWYVF